MSTALYGSCPERDFRALHPLLRAAVGSLDESAIADPTYVLFGSAVLLLHGLRAAIGDIDIFVRPALYARLLRFGWRERWPRLGDPPLLEVDLFGLRAHAFARWSPTDPHVDVSMAFRYAEIVAGWPCTPLWLIRAHKAGALAFAADSGWVDEHTARRLAKHRADIAAIDARLASAA